MGWIDDRDFNEDTDFDDESNYGETACRDCGDEDVYWAKNKNGRWVLYGTDSRLHVCKKAALTESRLDAFPDLD